MKSGVPVHRQMSEQVLGAIACLALLPKIDPPLSTESGFLEMYYLNKIDSYYCHPPRLGVTWHPYETPYTSALSCFRGRLLSNSGPLQQRIGSLCSEPWRNP